MVLDGLNESLGALNHQCRIDDECCTVHMVKSGKTWKAYGTFRNKYLVGKGRTKSEAINNWKCLAEYEANA